MTPEGVEPPKPTREQANKLYEAWVIANHVRDYIQNDHPIKEAAPKQKLYTVWNHKADVLRGMLNRFGINAMAKSFPSTPENREVVDAYYALRGGHVRPLDHRRAVETLKKHGLPV